MKIESVDFFYLSMPHVLDIGDGSQDALVVRLRAGGYEGWGECEASPLVSIASFVAPLPHSACRPGGWGPGRAGWAAARRGIRRVGRVRGVAAGLNRQLRGSDVSQRLQAGER